MKYLPVLAVLLIGTPVLADGSHASHHKIMIHDAYARAASPSAKAGAIFMTIMNHGGHGDRLVSASSDAAAVVELHTHLEEDGVMKMTEDEDGFEVPAGGTAQLARGGDHVMLMGLTTGMEHGSMVEVTLTFEKAGDMTVEVPVDLHRKPASGGHGHSHSHSHSHSD